MDGLYIRKNGNCIEKAEKNSEKLELLAKGDGVEVMLQTIQPGQVFSVSPGDDKDLMEFFFILDGTVTYEKNGTNSVLGKGDYFCAHRISGTAYFKSENEVKMLYVSSQPVYHMLSNEIELLKEMLVTISEKDMYTHDHDLRLVNYCLKIGNKLRLSKVIMENLYYAAIFHDLGKLKVPDEILKKPGKLTEEEFEYIKKHPSDGKEMLKDTFLRDIGYIVEQHHERMNGSGYPSGLMGKDISIEAKIIAVVDSFDAMTSDRPYRKAMTFDAALDELRRLSGIHYDSEIVKTLEEIIEKEHKND